MMWLFPRIDFVLFELESNNQLNIFCFSQSSNSILIKWRYYLNCVTYSPGGEGGGAQSTRKY